MDDIVGLTQIWPPLGLNCAYDYPTHVWRSGFIFMLVCVYSGHPLGQEVA